jgi:hypothetical protein
VWVQLQRTHSDGPLIAMNVTDDAARAEEWRRMGRTIVEYAPAADPDPDPDPDRPYPAGRTAPPGRGTGRA